jgi:PKD repeat protein
MRSIRLLAVATGAVLLVSACGGDNGGVEPGENRPPVAGFSEVCTELSCVFTDTSTDPDGNNTITARSWNFGDDTPVSTATSPTHVYAAAGTYNVELTVTDNEGATDEFTKAVSVGTAANAAPTAGFTTACSGGACTFTNTSTDPDGTIVSQTWDFGDPTSANNTSTEVNGAHTYTVGTTAQSYTVTLTVTDDDSETATATQIVTISPPATLECADGSSCTIDVSQRSVVTVTMTTRDCQFSGNKLEIIAPIMQVLFTDGCAEPVGAVYQLNQGNPFEAGTQIQARFTQGTPTTPPPSPPVAPQIRVDGTFPDWTLNIDDGGTGPNEPDFNDIVLTVNAEAVP